MNEIALSLETYAQIRHFYQTNLSIRYLKILLTILLVIELFFCAVQLGVSFDYVKSIQDYMNFNDEDHIYFIQRGAEITKLILLLCGILVGLFSTLLESKSGLIITCSFNLATAIYTIFIANSKNFWQTEIFLLIEFVLAFWLYYLIHKSHNSYVIFT